MVIETVISGLLGIAGGTVGYYYTNKLIEKNREFKSTKREQLQYVFGPLEVLLSINKREFLRYMNSNSTIEDKTFIEQHIWYPNNSQIKLIIMEKSHLLPSIPDLLLDLLTHINVWLTEYDLVYNQMKKKPPVFAGTRGYPFPHKADDFVIQRAIALRKELNLR